MSANAGAGAVTSAVAQRRGGIAAVCGAVLATAGDLVVHTSSAHVASDQVSYPLTSTTWSWFQVFFALTQGLLAIGIITLVRSGLVRGRGRSVFGTMAAVGFALTAPGELMLIAAASSTNDSSTASTVSTVFGVIVLVADVGLIGYGVTAIRQCGRHVALAWLPLVLGVFHLLVLTPVSLATGFASNWSLAAFLVAYLLNAAIGLTLVRGVAAPLAPNNGWPVLGTGSTIAEKDLFGAS